MSPAPTHQSDDEPPPPARQAGEPHSGRSKTSPSGRSKKLLANHQRSWIWGKHLVQETLAAGRWTVLELFLDEHLGHLEHLNLPSSFQQTSPIQRVSKQRLSQLCGAEDHQGWVARVGPFPYLPLEVLIAQQPANPCWLLIEGLQDPYNLGTILRSAEVFAVSGVCLSSSGQTGINSLAARSSVGAVNRVPIAQVDQLIPVIERLRDQGIVVLGTSLQTELPIDSVDCTRGIAFVIGNEARGLTPQLAAACSQLVKIPQPGTLNSLNAAAAAAILCYEVQRQRRAITT